MKQELLEQLKKAGLSQKGKGEHQFYIGEQRVVDDVGMQAESYYLPTLSELIDWCIKQIPSAKYSFNLNIGNLYDAGIGASVTYWTEGVDKNGEPNTKTVEVASIDHEEDEKAVVAKLGLKLHG